MASSAAYMEFMAGQLNRAGAITYKKMFGEYGLYCNGVFFGTVEDDQLYVKITGAGEALLGERAVVAEPHAGARLFLIENVDDPDFLGALVQETCAALPPPRPRKKKQNKTELS